MATKLQLQTRDVMTSAFLGLSLGRLVITVARATIVATPLARLVRRRRALKQAQEFGANRLEALNSGALAIAVRLVFRLLDAAAAEAVELGERVHRFAVALLGGSQQPFLGA